ncbi:adenylosuccinate synthetase [Buchnera aphidicola str. Bp (Baizongia pistaciae)]|uniref:Adenylosuccinate synthetase n=1 Tax=Buchnera aphidicola subsp. Baizongia pistaciae (strain Bp) TaxID=224915 RepID=PURA_BUCBP|nr:adenylosuccinate synthase [Buchnera aphidicola]P59428.1 RecName: Full=Adenylosuccinate synthetase; Short=AMPSase; Short=AdSS; AltName: Full=IMP--aspartate ligase [Buchnera aphidicola str. Bp (Baizongia pistaciae)]AAO27214.1 adenylosuccinate synthetase [Buchnera aphidicola str. Bp (Baizongia pistaciae)]
MSVNIVVIGMQWGDEGKGKIVDFLATHADYVVRYQGGHNAGHTLVVDNKKIVLHVLPSGILHNNIISIIANGVVLEPQSFINEIKLLEAENLCIRKRIFISESCNLIFPYHVFMDLAREKQKYRNFIGTTGCGIGPAYEDKVARRGLCVGDLLDLSFFSRKLEENVNFYNHQFTNFYHTEKVSFKEIFSNLLKVSDVIISMINDIPDLLNNAINDNKSIIFEGAQGTLLDIDHGIYPYVTSSSSVSGSVCSGAGVGIKNLGDIYGVVKAYSTRVGNGPFPTELFGELDAYFCRFGNEFGATTGRRRRTGWLDIVLLRRVISINSITKICLTKLDILDNLEKILICTSYHLKGVKNKKWDSVPFCRNDWDKIKPVYETFLGWKQNTRGITEFDELPKLAKKYIHRIEELIKVPVYIISTGPDRQDIIIRN